MELSERVTRVEERMATQDDVANLKEQIVGVERDLKEQIGQVERDLTEKIVGVQSDLQALDAKVDRELQVINNKMDAGFADIRHLIEDSDKKLQTSVLAAENKLLKRIIGWAMPGLVFLVPAMISLFSRFW